MDLIKIFRSNAPRSFSAHNEGFSLIEMMAVLAVLGLVIGVSVANLRPQVEAMRFRATSGDILNAVLSYRVAAITRRERVVFDAVDGGEEGVQFGAPPFDMDLPAGWRVDGGPLIFLASGACLGGDIAIIGKTGREARYSLSPPECKPVRQ